MHIRIDLGAMVIVSKLIDGDFPAWQNVTPNSELSGLLMPELEPRLPSGKVEALNKAVGLPLTWSMGDVGGDERAVINCNAKPNWQAVLCTTSTPVYPQGYFADGECTVQSDGATYPVAVKSGRIHLSKETVHALCGDDLFDVIEITLPADCAPGQADRRGYVSKWLYESGDSKFLTVPADGKVYGEKTAHLRHPVTRVYVDACLNGEVTATPISEAETVAPVLGEFDPSYRDLPNGDYQTSDKDGNIWLHKPDGSQELVHDESGDAMAKAVAFGKMMQDSADAFAAEFLSPVKTPMDDEMDEPADTVAQEVESPSCEPEISPIEAIAAQPDAMAALIARIETLEAALLISATTIEAVKIIATPSGAIEKLEALPYDPRMLSIVRTKQEIAAQTPLPVQSKSKRTAAHVRAIMAYLAMRALRSELAWRKADWQQSLDRAVTQIDTVCAERDQLRKSLETVQADSIRWQQQDAAREKADYAKRRRAILSARVRSQAAWQLGRALVISVNECERLKRVGYQQAGHIINLGERIDKAEQMLKTSGYWPDITVTAPDVIRMPYLAH